MFIFQNILFLIFANLRKRKSTNLIWSKRVTSNRGIDIVLFEGVTSEKKLWSVAESYTFIISTKPTFPPVHIQCCFYSSPFALTYSE